MKLAPGVLVASLCLAGWVQAQGLKGTPVLPSTKESWPAKLEDALTRAGVLGPDSKTWSGKEGTRTHLGASLDRTRQFETRLSMRLWARALPLGMARQGNAPELLESRSGETLSISGPGLVEGGELDFDRLLLLRNASWGGPHARNNPTFEALGLAVPGVHYALVIRTAELAPRRAAYRSAEAGLPLPLVESGSSRILDRMLAWELWDEDQGAGTVPFTLHADRVEATRWRFRASEFEGFTIYLLSTDLRELAAFLTSLQVQGLPTDLPPPAPAPAEQQTPAQTGLTGALSSKPAPTWTTGRTAEGVPLTRKADNRLVTAGAREQSYHPERHGEIAVFPSHPDYGRTQRGDPLYRVGGMLMTLSTFGTSHEYVPERHGAIVIEPPFPPHLGIAKKGNVTTYLVRRQGKVHALWKDIPSTYDPARHGEIVRQPQLPAELGATTLGYLVAQHKGRPYVLRREVPPTPWVAELHGAIATPPPSR